MVFALYLKTYNMIRFLLLFIGLGLTSSAIASPADSSVYQTQRMRINALLAERSAKFGQYDLSLSARTGIFGLQTKNDLKNSNEILRGIILNDNNIFRELKSLMDYKEQEVQQVQTSVISNKKRIQGYMAAIKTLQTENDKLKEEAAKVTKKSDTELYIIVFLSLVIVIGGIFFYNKISKKH